MRLILTVFLLTLSVSVFAQNKLPNDRKITRQEADSIRSVIMNRELLLNPTEASRFWPLYDRELKEIQNLNRDYFIWLNQNKNLVDRMTNSELQQFLQTQDEYLQKKLDIRRIYDIQFRKILSLKQLAHLYLSEDKYARALVQYRIHRMLNE